MNRFALLLIAIVSLVVLRLGHDLFWQHNAHAKELRIPFSQLPIDLLGPEWSGRNVDLDQRTLETAGVADFVNRIYSSKRSKIWFYVGYVSGWAPESVHHPKVCFPETGRHLTFESVLDVELPEVENPVTFSEYHWAATPNGEPNTFTLSTFVVNGHFEHTEIGLRARRFAGIEYFSIITISGPFLGTLEETRTIYSDLLQASVPQVLKHFPETGISN